MNLRCPDCELYNDFRVVREDWENEEKIVVLECPYCLSRREVPSETYLNPNV